MHVADVCGPFTSLRAGPQLHLLVALLALAQMRVTAISSSSSSTMAAAGMMARAQQRWQRAAAAAATKSSMRAPPPHTRVSLRGCWFTALQHMGFGAVPRGPVSPAQFRVGSLAQTRPAQRMLLLHCTRLPCVAGSAADLAAALRRIDGRGYKAYKDLEGQWAMGPQQLPGGYTLCVDWVQGDPFASPSRFRWEGAAGSWAGGVVCNGSQHACICIRAGGSALHVSRSLGSAHDAGLMARASTAAGQSPCSKGLICWHAPPVLQGDCPRSSGVPAGGTPVQSHAAHCGLRPPDPQLWSGRGCLW